MYRRTLALTVAQQAELVRVRDRDRRPSMRECAAALLQIADGRSPHAVAQGGLHKPRDPDTVYAWLDKYEAGGIVALLHKPRGHRGLSPSGGGRARRRAASVSSDVRPHAQPLGAG